MEGMAAFVLPYQQKHMMTGSLDFPARPMLVAPLSLSLANPPLSTDRSLTNLGLQSNQPGAADPQQLTALLLSELAAAQQLIMELEACLGRAKEESEMWQRIAKEHEAMVASLTQTVDQLCEPSIGSSPDADDAASCTGHPLTAEEPREGTGMELCNDSESPNSQMLLLPHELNRGYLFHRDRLHCEYELCEAFLGPCPHHKP